MKTLIVIPAYNEEANIKWVVENIKNVLPDYEYVVINDCSKDSTGRILDEYHYAHIDLPVNLGLVGAVQMGYKYAYLNNYDAVIQFDGDGQHQAEYIPALAKEVENGFDIVIGSRFVEFKKPWSLRMWGSRIITFLIRLTTGKTIKDPTSGMRLLNRKMMYDYAYNMNHKPEPDSLMFEIKNGAKVKEIQVEMNDRIAGVSLYSGLFQSLKYMLKMCISIIFIYNFTSKKEE